MQIHVETVWLYNSRCMCIDTKYYNWWQQMSMLEMDQSTQYKSLFTTSAVPCFYSLFITSHLLRESTSSGLCFLKPAWISWEELLTEPPHAQSRRQIENPTAAAFTTGGRTQSFKVTQQVRQHVRRTWIGNTLGQVTYYSITLCSKQDFGITVPCVNLKTRNNCWQLSWAFCIHAMHNSNTSIYNRFLFVI